MAAILDASIAASPLSVSNSETALILADYQNLIIGMLGDKGDGIMASAKYLRDWAEKQGIPVIIATVYDGRPPVPHSKMSVRSAGIIKTAQENPHVVEPHAGLGSLDGDNVYHVQRRIGLVSALNSEGLDELLARLGTKSLIVAGLSTSGCALSTVRDGTEKGYIVTVVVDGCADPAPGVHEAMCQYVFPMTAHVVEMKELEEAWEGKQ